MANVLLSEEDIDIVEAAKNKDYEHHVVLAYTILTVRNDGSIAHKVVSLNKEQKERFIEIMDSDGENEDAYVFLGVHDLFVQDFYRTEEDIQAYLKGIKIEDETNIL